MKKLLSYCFIFALEITIFNIFPFGIFAQNLYNTELSNLYDDDGIEISIEEFGSIILPSKMEIQSGNYKKLNDKLYEILGIQSENVVFQQKGLNNFSSEGFGTYARILIKTIISEPGAFPDLNNYNFTNRELKELEMELREGIEEAQLKLNMIVTKWYPIEIERESISNFPAIKIKYNRQLNNNPEVVVVQYQIFNNDRQHLITLSNRINDDDTWTPIFDEVKNSIRINKR